MTWLRTIPAIVVFGAGLQAQESEVDKRIRTVASLDVQLAKAFFNEIKTTIAKGDKRAVSKLISYPTTVNLKGEPNQIIRDRAEFESHYDDIINDRVIKVVRSQAYEDLFVNWRGVMFGRGEIWFSALEGPTGELDRFIITRVNN
jgi:hypothetical protein